MLHATLVAAVAAAAGETANPEVHLPHLGRVRGVLKDTPAGEPVEHFYGLRYTQAPVGDLRFRAPRDPLGWGETVFDATSMQPNACPGSYCEYVGGVDKEDCLFLNVFAPPGARERRRKLPVVVWIHGGGFGSGCANEFATEQLVASSVKGGHPIVAVSLNYRLNFFGFLGSDELRGNDTSESTGNYGILDQRKALEWVNRYIEHFGGNPRRVTIAGESAGAGSVSVHMVSEDSYKKRYDNGRLFSQAIAQSGLSATWTSKSLASAESVYTGTKDLFGCADAACLRAVPEEDFVQARWVYGSSAFSPVVDGVVLTDDVWKLVGRGEFADVPVLTGSTRDEYAYYMIYYQLMRPNANETDFDRMMRAQFPAGEAGDEQLNQLKQLYSESEYEYPENRGTYSYWWWAATAAQTDRSFFCQNRWGALQVASGSAGCRRRRWKRSAVFQYFLVRPTESTTIRPGTGPGAVAVPHASDLSYFFNCSLVSQCTDWYPVETCPKKEPYTRCKFDVPAEQRLGSAMSLLFTRFVSGRNLPRRFRATREHYDYAVGLDVSRRDGGRGFFPVRDNREAQCEFWDAIDRPNSAL